MFTVVRAAALLVSVITLVPSAQAAHGRSLCEAVNRDTVVSLFGKITATDVAPNACTFTTDKNGVTGLFGVMRHDYPVPESGYWELTLRTSDNDTFVDAPGIGEKAIINVSTHDMVVRVHGKIYSLSTRSMPCGSAQYGKPANQAEQAKCKITRLEALKQLGAQLAR